MINLTKKILSGSTLKSVHFISVAVVAIWLTPFIIHSIGDRMYGFWGLVSTIIGYYGLLDLGLSTAVSRYLAKALGEKSKIDIRNIVNTSFFIFVVISFVVIIVTLMIAYTFPYFYKNIASSDLDLFRKIIMILGVDIALSFPMRLYRGILVAKIRYDIISVIGLITLGLRSGLIIVALMSGYGVMAMAIVTVLAKIPEYVLTVLYAKKNLREYKLTFSGLRRDTALSLFSFSLFIFIAQIANILRFQIDIVVITGFMGLVAGAHYRIGSLVANMFFEFMIGSISILTAVFSRLEGEKENEKITQTLLFSTKITLSLSTFCCFGIIFWGASFIELWVGPEYLDAYPVLVILSIGFHLSLWQACATSLLIGTSKHKFLALLNTIEGVTNLLLSIILVRHYGLIGVALGTAIPLTISKLIIQPVYVSNILKVPYWQYMMGFVKTSAISFITLIVPGCISIQYVAPDFKVLIFLGLFSLVFLIIGIWFFELKKTEKKILLDLTIGR